MIIPNTWTNKDVPNHQPEIFVLTCLPMENESLLHNVSKTLAGASPSWDCNCCRVAVVPSDPPASEMAVKGLPSLVLNPGLGPGSMQHLVSRENSNSWNVFSTWAPCLHWELIFRYTPWGRMNVCSSHFCKQVWKSRWAAMTTKWASWVWESSSPRCSNILVLNLLRIPCGARHHREPFISWSPAEHHCFSEWLIGSWRSVLMN